jgi:cell division initiation protein
MLFHMQIPEVSFSKSFRGYDTQQVQDYVQSVALFEEEMNRQHAIMTDRVQALDKEVNRLREVETSLFRAMKLAEEAQKNWQDKVETEAGKVIENAKKQAAGIISSAEKDALKAKLLIENERKQLLTQVEQEVKEQTRELARLKNIQTEIAGQLANFAQQTLRSIESWSKPIEEKQVAAIPKKPLAKVPPKKAVVDTKAKPSKSPVKKGKHLDASTIEDDGLPTLNKVLEAYAKTTGPRGKVGEIN